MSKRWIRRAWECGAKGLAGVGLAVAVGLLLGAGSVRTRDGKVHEGEVALEDGAVVVKPTGGGEVRVAWAEVQRAIFVARPAPKRMVARTEQTLPEGWKSQDIGQVYKPGSATCDEKGLFRLTASGWGAWGAEDSLQFAYGVLEGDGQIFARVVKLDDAHGAMAGGIMLRQSVAADAPMASASVQPSGEVRLSCRPMGEASEGRREEEVTARPWIRLTRRGDLISVYGSRDGRFWDLVESESVAMKDPVLVGVGAWSTGNAWVGEVQIDSVAVVPGTPGASYFADGDRLTEGVVLRDGTVLAGAIQAADDREVRLVRSGVEQAIPVNQVARLIFNPAPPELAKLRGQRGVMLANGDFIEGEISGVALRNARWPRPKQLQVGVKSVLFGVKYFETAREVIAVVMGDVTPGAAGYEVVTADGSVQRAKEVVVKKGGIEVDGAVVGDVVEVRRP